MARTSASQNSTTRWWRSVHQRGDAVAVRDATRHAPAGACRWWWQQRSDAPPQLVGQESVDKASHAPEHPKAGSIGSTRPTRRSGMSSYKEAPPGPRGRFRFSGRSIHGVTRLMRVPQLARAVRVAPQLPIGAISHWVRVQVWLMYSEAIQMLLPSIAVAP